MHATRFATVLKVNESLNRANKMSSAPFRGRESKRDGARPCGEIEKFISLKGRMPESSRLAGSLSTGRRRAYFPLSTGVNMEG